MTMIGTADISSVDLGAATNFGDRMALARVLGGTAQKVAGQWKLRGGVRDDVRLDHPTVVRVLGAPIEAEAGTVRWEPDAEETVRIDAAPIIGERVRAYLDRLVCERKLDYALALVNELSGGAVAEVPAGMRPELAQDVARRVRSLARKDAVAR